MISELSQPLLGILVFNMLGNVVNEQSADSSAIISTCDCSVAFLAGGVPDLGFYCFVIDLNAACGEFNANG